MKPFRGAQRRALVLVIVLALGLTACGDENSVASPGTDQQGSGMSDSGVEVNGSTEDKPEIVVPDGEPPAELEITDLVQGDGDEAEAGATVTTHYVGVSWSNGEQFDASWDRGEPISFPLSGVITGWQDGIPGMRVGGRRVLVIPPDQAYGDNPPPGAGIAPGETLVFVIDLVEVN